MFATVKKWWNRNETRLSEIENKMTSIATENSTLVQAQIQLEQDKSALQAELDVARTEQTSNDVRKNSNEPWVEVKSAEFHTERGVQIDLDWNPAFIQYLRENGIKGKTEQIIIQKWLAFLYDDLVVKLEDASIEESMATTTTPGEFE